MGRRFNTREGQTFLFFLLAMFILSFCFSTSGSVRDIALFSYCSYWKCLEICFQLLKFVRQAHFEEEVMLNQDTKFGVHIFERDEII